jgi:pSer/pThr/pTyr-binding forkhead associated (FHA) protein
MTKKDVAPVKLTLPYLNVFQKHDDFSPKKMNEVVRQALKLSAHTPCFLEVADETQQCFLFFREQQIYSAGRVRDGQFMDSTIKEFFLTTSQFDHSSAACYEVNAKILHSLLILVQKKPSLTLLTSLVDLDDVLDKIETERKSCVVCATQDDFLALLRYEKGRPTAMCHEQTPTSPREGNFREDFLVDIYSMSEETPFTITLFDDLLVKYSVDAKMIADGYEGDITDLFLSKPPVVSLCFKGKEIEHWILDKPTMNIGRTADNDIVIDNLAVSRLHAVLEREKGEYYIRDCDSMNGTFLNGQRVGRSRLGAGDEIVIGKHSIKVQRQSGIEQAAGPDDIPFDQTVVIQPGQLPTAPPQPGSDERKPARLIDRSGSDDIVIELSMDTLVFGKGTEADIEIEGFLVAGRHAEIVRDRHGYRLRHVSGMRRVSVSGRPVKECVLRDQDEIKIGKNEFVFQE